MLLMKANVDESCRKMTAFDHTTNSVTKGKAEDSVVTVEEFFPEETLIIMKAISKSHTEARHARLDKSSRILEDFFLKMEPGFSRVTMLRDMGWFENKEKADAFFEIQRKNADNADSKGRRRFHVMMIQIAEEMHKSADVFSVLRAKSEQPKVLDICMAPGGYTAATLNFHPDAKCYGISLPEKMGGHPLLIEKAQLSGLQLVDVTLLAKEYSQNLIPETHLQKSIFLSIRPFHFHKFDLIFCDGKVLRTHGIEAWREETEIRRLISSQLILAMQRIRLGGTLVMLMHKVDAWDTFLTIRTFSQFASIQLFKSSKKHAARSSFYMIAKNVDISRKEAQEALSEWRDDWWQSTFGGKDGTKQKKSPPTSYVLKVLDDFGRQFICLARPIWKIQADALSKTDYAGQANDSLGSSYHV